MNEERVIQTPTEDQETPRMNMVEKVLAWRAMKGLGPKAEVEIGGTSFTGSFDGNYSANTRFSVKYQIAKALLEDGRFPDPNYLVRSFIPAKHTIEELNVQSPTSDEDVKEQRDYQNAKQDIESGHAQVLKDQLQLLLVEQGHVKIGSDDEKEAHQVVNRFIDKDAVLSQLVDLLPIHVMGAITSAQMFENATGDEKKEKLRSFSTRALLIRPHLGNLLVTGFAGGLDYKDILSLVPEKIFRDSQGATLNVVQNHLTNLAMTGFIDAEEAGFSRMQDTINQEVSDVRRQFTQQILDEFREIAQEPTRDVFKDEVDGWFTDKSPFPLFRQKWFAHEFAKTRRKLLNGDTGATKTACLDLSMETLGAKRVTIFGPAIARNAWPREADKIYKEDKKPDVFAVRGAKDLQNPRIETAKQIFVSSQMLARAWDSPELYQKMVDALVERRDTDGLGLDESDEFRNPNTKSAKMLIDIVTRIKTKYAGRSSEKIPILALTATPISGALSDLDITMALLYEDRFALPGVYEEGKFTFSTQVLKDPKIAFSVLFGEQLITQWTLQDLFGEKVPIPEPFVVPVKMTPAQRAIYNWVEDLAIKNPLLKVTMLRGVLMNPELIKRTCKERELIPQPVYDPEQLGAKLQELHQAWQEWFLSTPEQLLEPFSADWIAQFGDQDFLIQMFFDDRFPSGIESLVSRYPEIFADWQKAESLSGKYQELRKFLESKLIKGEDGYTSREKVFIVSPFHKRGVTRDLEDPETKDEDLEDDTLSLFEIIRSEWFPDMPKEMAINIDGTKSFATREREAAYWRESGTRNTIVVASMKSVYESMDWAIRDTEDNQNIETLNVNWLGEPWRWEQKKQMNGRFPRPGLSKKVNVFIYETEDSIDLGFKNVVHYTNLLTQLALAGVELSPEDAEFFRRTSSASRILEYEPSASQIFLYRILGKMKSLTEEQIDEELEKQKDGRDIRDLFAEFYFNEAKDEYRIVGNNAEMVKNIILRDEPQNILSVGAGTCLLARKATRSGFVGNIDNLDINGAVLRIAKERYPEIGRIIRGKASHIDARPESYDAVDCSFMLSWTEQKTRVQILSEINRVSKPGARVVFTFPESSFDEETFSKFAGALSAHFGFKLLEPSGIASATDIKPAKRIGWVITAERQDTVNLDGLDAQNLTFLNEKPRVSKGKGAKPDKPTVIHIDYPIFDFKSFQVYNPLTREVSSANSKPEETIQIPIRDLVDQIKVNLSESQFNIWRDARRRIEGSLNQSYPEAEETLVRIFQRRKLGLNIWSEEALRKIVDAEIRRLIRFSRNGFAVSN